MKKVHLLLIVLFLSSAAAAQIREKYSRKKVDTWCYSILKRDNKELFLREFVIRPNEIESSKILGDRATKLKYGVNCVFVITIKPDTKVLSVKDMFDKYKIPESYQKLPIYLDGEIYSYPDSLLLVTVKALKSVDIKEKSEDNLKYIDIITSRPRANKESIVVKEHSD